jgi:uncharacterized protein YggE
MEPGTVTVRGSAAVPAQPDRVELSFTVTAVEQSAAAALAVVGTKSERLGQVLETLGVPRAQWSTSGATVQEAIEWDGSRQVHRGFRGTYQVVVRLADPALVGPLMQDAVDSTGAAVAGPWWRLDPANPAHLQASRLAAANARSKADAYAAGLGLRIGTVVAVREPQTGGGPPVREEAVLLARASGPPQQPLDVQPGALDVAAAVEVTFRLEAV